VLDHIWTIIFVVFLAVAFGLAHWHDREEARRRARRVIAHGKEANAEEPAFDETREGRASEATTEGRTFEEALEGRAFDKALEDRASEETARASKLVDK
jgi:hypothetical protein